MASLPQTFIIVGAGLAGARAAETLRNEGFGGRILLLGAETERPYERPPLSKGYLRGEEDGEPFVHQEGYYGDQWIDLRTSARVVQIDLAGSEVVLEGAQRVRYDRLLLTTGATPRRLHVTGADLEGVHYLRTLEDSRRLAARVRPGGRLVVIGAGWIGSEVAASARQQGAEVTIVAKDSVPLGRVLGPAVGSIYREIHADHGVRFLPGTEVESIEGDTHVEGVRLAGGELIGADDVVVGIGVSPASELAEEAGLATGDGILVDSGLRTSAPDVFAAGDVAGVEHPFYGRRVRVEHWANAGLQGRLAARAMLGEEVIFDEIPYFFSDQYDVGMEYAGLGSADDEVVLRGDVASREFIAFWIRDGRVTAGMNVNVWDVNESIRELVRSGAQPAVSELTDPAVPLTELVTSEQAGTLH